MDKSLKPGDIIKLLSNWIGADEGSIGLIIAFAELSPSAQNIWCLVNGRVMKLTASYFDVEKIGSTHDA